MSIAWRIVDGICCIPCTLSFLTERPIVDVDVEACNLISSRSYVRQGFPSVEYTTLDVGLCSMV